MLKYAAILLSMTSIAWAEADKQTQEQSEQFDLEMNLEMCRSMEHRFDPATNQCVYCAHGLQYVKELSVCKGTPDAIGKCYGDDHYHAATQECMYCAKGYTFNEDIRACTENQGSQGKK